MSHLGPQLFVVRWLKPTTSIVKPTNATYIASLALLLGGSEFSTKSHIVPVVKCRRPRSFSWHWCMFFLQILFVFRGFSIFTWSFQVRFICFPFFLNDDVQLVDHGSMVNSVQRGWYHPAVLVRETSLPWNMWLILCVAATLLGSCCCFYWKIR